MKREEKEVYLWPWFEKWIAVNSNVTTRRLKRREPGLSLGSSPGWSPGSSLSFISGSSAGSNPTSTPSSSPDSVFRHPYLEHAILTVAASHIHF